MPYLIDGHNLIGTWPGARVGSRADEAELRRLLGRFLRRRRVSATVVFDGRAPADLAGDDLRLGPLRVIYAGPGRDAADRKILGILERLSRPREWTVVTSDRALGQAARTRGGRWLSCARFRGELEATADAGEAETDAPTLDPEELDEWLRLFGADGKDE